VGKIARKPANSRPQPHIDFSPANPGPPFQDFTRVRHDQTGREVTFFVTQHLPNLDSQQKILACA